MILRNTLTPKQWARSINGLWRQATAHMLVSILQVGARLLDAKAQLAHGDFQAMVADDLEFTPRTAQMLMAVARDKRLTKAKHASFLPPHWYTLYLITKLDDALFYRLVDDGTICRDMGRGDISKVLRIERVQADERRILNLTPVAGKFRTIVLDPAWEYDWISVAGRAKPGYAMQTLKQLYALDVMAWADTTVGCHLYCWVTNNFMYEANKLIQHWGFQHRTVLTWVKPEPFGLGSYFRNSTEHVIFATVGETTTRPAAASIPTHFLAPRGEHSEKPEQFYEIVQAASYYPYGEANQRKVRVGFTPLFCPVTYDGASLTVEEATA